MPLQLSGIYAPTLTGAAPSQLAPAQAQRQRTGEESEDDVDVVLALESESDDFLNSEEYEAMQDRFMMRFYPLEDMIGEVTSLPNFVRLLRDFTDKMERLEREGWELDIDDFGMEGGVFLTNPAEEREQWRQRRQRRRMEDADMLDAEPNEGQPNDRPESGGAGTAAPPAQAAAAATAPTGSAPSESAQPKNSLASPAFVMF